MANKYSYGHLKISEQSNLSTGLLATGYFVNTHIINNGKFSTLIFASDIVEQL